MFSKFGISHEIAFTYWNYQKAWETNIFYQNKTFHHSWSVRMKIQNASKTPMWFLLKFWVQFGASTKILPDTIQAIFDNYCSALKEQQKNLIKQL